MTKNIFFLFLLISGGLSAQQIFTYHITPQGKLHHIHQLPFDHVVILDNRLDSTIIATRGDGIHPEILWKVDSPASSAIANYIESRLSEVPKKSGQLFVSLKQLRYQNLDDMTMYFSADAYLQKNDSFFIVAKVRRKYSFYNSPNSIGKRIARALDDLVKAIDVNYYKEANVNGKGYSYQDISKNVLDEWSGYPILQVKDFSKVGVYQSIEDLRNNTPTPANVSMKMEPDSSFQIIFNDHASQKKWETLDNVFAVCCHDSLYVKLMGRYFLPLTRDSSLLWLHVPSSLPNMYAIIAAINMPYKDHTIDPSGATSVGGALFLFAINVALQIKPYKDYANAQNKVYENGMLSGDFRTCLLDMDTGDIIY